MVEQQPSKLNDEGSIPFTRFGRKGRQTAGRVEPEREKTGETGARNFRANSCRLFKIGLRSKLAAVAQLVEHVLGKDEVMGSKSHQQLCKPVKF
jgi:hypothetical protein